MRCSLRLPLLLCCFIALTGCATNPYTSTAPKNLTIQSELDSGSVLGSARGAMLEIYRLSKKCPLESLGTVDLETEQVQLGLETGRPAYLRFVFTQAGASGSTEITWGTVITPRPGAQYAAKVRFAENMYEARVEEIGKGGAIVHKFGRQGFPCQEP